MKPKHSWQWNTIIYLRVHNILDVLCTKDEPINNRGGRKTQSTDTTSQQSPDKRVVWICLPFYFLPISIRQQSPGYMVFWQDHIFPRTWSVGLINVEHDGTWWRPPSRPLASSPQPSCGLSWSSCLLSCFSWTFKLSKDPDENMITIVLEQPTCWSSLPTT